MSIEGVAQDWLTRVAGDAPDAHAVLRRVALRTGIDLSALETPARWTPAIRAAVAEAADEMDLPQPRLLKAYTGDEEAPCAS